MKGCVIGAGRMGMRHVQVLQSENVDIVGIADMREEARATVTEAGLSESVFYADPKAMLDATSPELVVIATTAPSHYPLTLLAVEKGATHILCEKPMGCSIRQCEEMIRVCEEADVLLAVNHQMRFMEQYVRVKQALADEGYGALASVTITAGNFGCSMNGSHYFEMFRFICDEDIAAVCAWFDESSVANPRGDQFRDRSGCIRAVTASGKRFYMDASGDQGHGVRVTYAAHNGQITVDELDGKLWSVVRKREHAEQPTTRYGMPWHTTEEAITPADSVTPTRSVLAALLRGDGFPSGKDGLHAVRALTAAYASNKAGGAAVSLRATAESEEVFPWA